MDISTLNVDLVSIKGNICDTIYLLKYNDNKLLVHFKNCTIIDVDNDYIYITMNESIKNFNKSLKNSIIKRVNKKSRDFFGVYKSKESLEEFYCNPCKTKFYNNKYIKILKIKNKNINHEVIGKDVNIFIDVYGVWFSKKSFGLFYIANELNVINDTCLIKYEDSDSDFEF
jgi:hypothetical protein